MTGPSVCSLLEALASNNNSPRQRNQACKELHALLNQRGPGLLRDLRAKLSDDDLEDVLQHILTQASTGSARCKAQSEGEAWSWCLTVARNYALALLRRQTRETPDEVAQEASVPSENALEPLLEQVEQQLQRAALEVQQMPRGNEKMASVFCAIEYCLRGASIDEQIARWAFPQGQPANLDANALRLARNRIYAYRSRGVCYLLDALHHLEATREFELADTQLARTILSQMKRR